MNKWPGATLPLVVLQRRLRWSAVGWLLWFVAIAPLFGRVPLMQGYVLALLGALPALLSMPVFWRAKNGRLLIFAALILLLYLGHAVLGVFRGEWLRTALALGFLVNLLFWCGWVIERLPRLQAND